MNTPYDDPHGDLLGRVLKAEADTILPAGDGLSRIRERVERRRSRVRWLMPAASLATAGALAGAAFGAYTALSGSDRLHSQLAHTTPSGPPSTQQPAPSTSPTSPTQQPSPSTAPVATFPDVSPVWPFSSYAEAQQWQKEYGPSGHSSWHLDPALTAQAFVDSLKLPTQQLKTVSIQSVSDRSGVKLVAVKLATLTTGDGQPHEFGTVDLVRWGSGPTAPWEVTGVTTDGARIDSPAPDATVRSPLAVRYTLDGGAEENVHTSIWDGKARLASVMRVVGGGSQQAGLSFTAPATSTGYVVVADVQGASGVDALQRLVVTPVRFATGSATTPASAKYPPFFLAVSNQRIALYYSTLGGFGRYVTEQRPGNVYSPQLSADGAWVYFLRDDGTGTESLMRVPIRGGAEQTVVQGVGRTGVTAFAIGGAHAQRLVFATTASGTQDVKWWDKTTGRTGHIHIPGVPPMVEQLAWAPDGRHFTAEIRTGTTWELRTYDANNATSVTSGVVVPTGSGAPVGSVLEGPSYDAAGNLYYLRTIDGTHLELVQYDGSQVRHVSTLTVPPGSPEDATVDITPDAYAALVSTPQGEIYRVNDGVAHLLPTAAMTATW
jgi:hypothetical protein